MKVCIFPRWDKPDKADGGIRRVVEAQEKYLPGFGIEVVAHPDDADVIATHGTTYLNRPPDKPVVNHNHGMYWSKYDWPRWAHHANSLVVEAMARAQFHTAPSRWVANALSYGMMVYPEVVHHGVDADKWTPGESDGYVLWNKARSDAVSDPSDMLELARQMPDVRFLSTIGKGQNVQEIGVMPVEQMKNLVRGAGLYLATARETFGIGTLEAMSCAVPVVGWDWGGQSEIVKHGETGFLAKPGDYAALSEGVRWAMAHRDILGANARQDVLDRWGWESRIEQYADIYTQAKEWWDAQEVKISVVVTTHNLARFLGGCLESVAAQEGDWECIVVDDASEDNPASIVEASMESGPFKLVRSDDNLKLPEARNRGFELARGRYILFLDADDMLAEGALRTLSEQLDLDPSIHVAYGHLDTVSEDGSNRQRNPWPYKEFSWRGQMAHLNQLPYAAMMRREVMERTGGYRRRHWRNEDAPLWILSSSYGFRIKKVTEASTLVYRWRPDSKTQQELKQIPEGDWTSWFPWRMGAETAQEGAKLMRSNSAPRWDLVPWSAQAPSPSQHWPVPDRTDPRISVVIPVGPGHEKYVVDALDSLRSQTFQDWECVVVNVTGKTWPGGFRDPVRGCPWARVVDAGQVLRPSAARNLGIKYARAEALLILDADDVLLPHALEEMYSWYVGTGGLIYTDWLKAEPDPLEPMQLVKTGQFQCGAVLRRMQHSMMCMLPKAKHEQVGGYDESMPGWEDWDYLIALQAGGLCSYRVPSPCFVYRFRTGTIREQSFSRKDETLRLIRSKWADYYEGRKTMPCGSCPGGKKAAINPSANPSAMSNAKLEKSPSQMVLLSYQGPDPGKHVLRGPVTRAVYIFHPNQPKYVMPEDAQVFLGRRRNGKPDFVEIRRPSEPPRVEIPVAFEADHPQEPDFPEMPPADPSVSDMTLKQLRDAVVDATPSKVLQWLQQEREDRNRKGAIRILEEAAAREPA